MNWEKVEELILVLDYSENVLTSYCVVVFKWRSLGECLGASPWWTVVVLHPEMHFQMASKAKPKKGGHLFSIFSRLWFSFRKKVTALLSSLALFSWLQLKSKEWISFTSCRYLLSHLCFKKRWAVPSQQTVQMLLHLLGLCFLVTCLHWGLELLWFKASSVGQQEGEELVQEEECDTDEKVQSAHRGAAWKRGRS